MIELPERCLSQFSSPPVALATRAPRPRRSVVHQLGHPSEPERPARSQRRPWLTEGTVALRRFESDDGVFDWETGERT